MAGASVSIVEHDGVTRPFGAVATRLVPLTDARDRDLGAPQCQPKEREIRCSGLTQAEAAARLAQQGYNELERPRRRTIIRIARDVFREPMFQLLLAAGAVYLVLGDLREALMLLGFALVNVLIVAAEESKTERVLEALRDLTSPRALVIRDEERRRIPARDVVRGDLVILEEGDRVPADALLRTCHDLEIDESLLTGESVPVRKRPWDGSTPPPLPGGDDQPTVYAATLVTRGQGVGEVVATGRATEVGKIGLALCAATPEPSSLEQETRPLVRWIALTGLSLSMVMVLLYGFVRADWLGGLLAGITLAMAMVPQEFPLVLAVFLALGAWRLSQRRVLTRRAAAIERLGAATVLCVDKTGTLTQNHMTVRTLVADGACHAMPAGQAAALPERFHALLEFAILASESDPFDPMERAFHELGARCLTHTDRLHPRWTLVHEYPLSPELFAMTHVWDTGEGDNRVVATKGAPEAIAKLCRLGPERAAAMAREVSTMAQEGARVLAVAGTSFHWAAWPASQHEFDFAFLGLIGLTDPLRPGVPEAIAECRRAGIRVVMVTGDHPTTARAVALEAGLIARDETAQPALLTGDELSRMSDADVSAAIGGIAGFARMTPGQKLRLVNAFKASGAIVAMTGDGVNDAPSLKAAHIGIAMGGRGTDVAREAAALVLLDDDFASIVAAVRLGRRILDNLGKAMAYILAVHVPIAGLSLLPLLLGWPAVFAPAHIVFLELVIDPVCSIVFEAEAAEPDIMRRPPREPRRVLFGGWRLGLSLMQGASVLVVLLAILVIARAWGLGEGEARALAFVTLVVANIALILANRSWTESVLATLGRRNAALWWAVGAAVAMLGCVLAVPALRLLFQFEPLHADDLVLCLAAGVASVAWFEALKFARKRLR